MRLKTFVLLLVLGAGLVLAVALTMFTSFYVERAVAAQAVRSARGLARQTFQAMFQIMRQGWTRPQVEEFLRATGASFQDSAYGVQVYRGPVVEELFGPISQPPLDAALRAVLASGSEWVEEEGPRLRYIYPLVAQEVCLRCHRNARAGTVLGVIEVRADLGPDLAGAQRRATAATFAFLIPVLGGLFALVSVSSRRIDRALAVLRERVSAVHRVEDVTNLGVRDLDLRFAEFREIFDEIDRLSQKLVVIGVDRDVLEFEVRLLEKFVITSEVVRDWQEHLRQLLLEINKVMEVYFLFAVFVVEDERYDLDVFWRSPPTAATRARFEEVIRDRVAEHPRLGSGNNLTFVHHTALPGADLNLERHQIEVATKTLFLDHPRIGGIVGVGVHAGTTADTTRHLVIESVLSTLLNVVGSVKAIYRYTRELEYYATRDPLTDLYNQRVFWELLEYEVGRAERHGYRFALMVVDLDNFKSINDAYGHAFGDLFLQEVARTLRRELRAGDILARYGGDEFALILPETGVEQAYAVGERLLAAVGRLSLGAPDGSPVRTTASVGVAVLPDHARNGRDLFLMADNMMYRAKALGKGGVAVPSPDDVVAVWRSVGEKTMLIMRALEEGNIVPHFQPILDLRTGAVAGHEALMRIPVAEGLMAAAEFVELAGTLGVMNRLDYVLMDRVFSQAAAAGYRGLIFLNISPKALIMREFIPTVKRMVERYGIAPAQVVFEITERETVRNLSLLERFVVDLKLEGFQFAIDDFGSGFSSFQYIKRFPVDFVKIEGDFVRGMVAPGGVDRAVVLSVVALARALGIRTVAECVESAEVMEAARAAGVDLAQGFHVGAPAPALEAGERRSG